MQQGVYHLFTALGNALFSSFWQMGLSWLLVMLYSHLRPGLSPTSKSLLNFAGLLTGFAAFLLTFIISLVTPQTENGLLKWLINREWIHNIFNYGAVLYLLLLAIPAKNIIRSACQVYRLRKDRLERVPGTLKIFMLDAVNYLGIKRKVQLYASSIVSSPLTIGFLKPMILLPLAVINQLTPQQLEAILLHELAHIKRNDYLINLINQIILAVLYFNPFAKLLVKAQELEREKSADQWVLQFQYGQHLYASTLLQLARDQHTFNALAMHVSGKESQLSQRVQAIMGIEKKQSFPLKKVAMLVLFLLLSGGFYYSANKNVPAPVTTAIASLPYFNPEALNPVFAAKQNLAKNEFKIIPIPAIEKPDSGPADNAIYLKITEDPNGKIEAPAKPKPIEAGPEANPSFVSHITLVVPNLDSTAEHTVQESIKTLKQIVTEMAWEKIENSLAETVSEAQKKILKARMEQAFDKLNWEESANKLRALYNEIDWAKAEAQLNASLDAILSSKKNPAACKNAIRSLQTARKTSRQSAIAAAADSAARSLQQEKIIAKRTFAADSNAHKKIMDL
ncbi:hypothetical protein A8C56_10360 [Niabella ginsenosidivorans]|uniref:Peptidase M56 domain-containing protein n=1 Tax=Niabella ginsenosidivorans TaxID=1176587 RepID=A0A1A9I1D8_9BACT|nr:M56 family metallopeptidase [Niabella ginsenosidivorans]ANH81333.1 hypothetical protein A8C56_10360 [Niabella ginsenosidivorans]